MAAGCTYLLVEVQGSPGRSGLADRRAPSPAASAAVDEALLAAGGTIVGEQLTGGDVPRRVVSALYTLGRDAVRAALTLPGLATKDGGARVEAPARAVICGCEPGTRCGGGRFPACAEDLLHVTGRSQVLVDGSTAVPASHVLPTASALLDRGVRRLGDHAPARVYELRDGRQPAAPAPGAPRGRSNRAARGVIPLAPYAVEHLTRAIVNARCPSPPATRQRVPQHQWLVEVGSP